ncbi:MAG: hypothetical protein EXR71_18865 [Myxococcales bacterium]|nr:hypothetical protein [Myxococcales bacterium]
MFARLRWFGVALFIVAVPIPGAVLVAIVQGSVPWTWIFPAMGCLGLSLGAFGTANDTALHALRTAGRGGLPESAARELEHEEAVRPARLAQVHHSPKASVIIPFVAAALMVYVVRHLIYAESG